MKWVLALVFCLSCPVLALTPVYVEHKTLKEVDDEFQQLYKAAQPVQGTILYSTPTWQDLQDGQFVIVTATGSSYVTLQLRVGTTNYLIRFSTIQGR